MGGLTIINALPLMTHNIARHVSIWKLVQTFLSRPQLTPMVVAVEMQLSLGSSKVT